MPKQVDRDLQDALRSTSLVLRSAAEKRLNVVMLCSSLGETVRDGYYKDANGVRFADDVNMVLKVGAKVSILIWNSIPNAETDHEPIIAESVAELIRLFTPDLLDVRITGFREGAELVSHFVCAVGTRDNGSDWSARLEVPHPLAQKSLITPGWQAAGEYAKGLRVTDDQEARELLSPHLHEFWSVFNAISVSIDVAQLTRLCPA